MNFVPAWYRSLNPRGGSALADKISLGVTYAGLFLIFALAAWARYSLPPVPFFNPDALGYVGPALHHLLQGEMQQTFQREFFYPFFLRLVMMGGADLGWLTHVQHLAGLAAGAVWWLIWSSWMARWPEGWVRRIVGPVLGLFLLLIFLWSTQGIALEHNVRPEGIFSFWALSQVLLTGWVFILATSTPAFPRAAMGVAFLAVLAGCGAQALRPSWVLAWVGPATMVFLLMRCLGCKARRMWGILASMGFAFLFWKAFLASSEQAFSWKKEAAPSDILAKALVSVHVPQILAYWTDPERWAALSETDRDFLLRLQQGMLDSQKQRHSYAILGFDPDYIWFRTDILSNLPVPPEQHISYLMSWHRPLLLRSPWLLWPKVQRQILVVSFPSPKILYANSLETRRLYERSLAELELRCEQLPSAMMIPWEPYREKLQMLAQEAPEKQTLTPTMNRVFLEMVQFAFLPALLFSFLAGVGFLLWGNKGEQFWVEPALWASFFVGAVATVAVVHSFDIGRYQYALVPLHLLVVGGGVALILLRAEKFLRTRLSRLRPVAPAEP